MKQYTNNEKSETKEVIVWSKGSIPNEYIYIYICFLLNSGSKIGLERIQNVILHYL